MISQHPVSRNPTFLALPPTSHPSPVAIKPNFVLPHRMPCLIPIMSLPSPVSPLPQEATTDAEPTYAPSSASASISAPASAAPETAEVAGSDASSTKTAASADSSVADIASDDEEFLEEAAEWCWARKTWQPSKSSLLKRLGLDKMSYDLRAMCGDVFPLKPTFRATMRELLLTAVFDAPTTEEQDAAYYALEEFFRDTCPLADILVLMGMEGVDTLHALDLACRIEDAAFRARIIQLLLKYKANPLHSDHTGCGRYTFQPAMTAALWERWDVVQLFRDHGMDMAKVKTREGMSLKELVDVHPKFAFLSSLTT